MSQLRSWAVFISGRGSNLQAILENAADLNIDLVVSSRARAPGLLRARRQGMRTLTLPAKIDWDVLDGELRRRGITSIFLAGFMKLIPAAFVQKWEGRILNVHPSLLPAYPGLNALEKSQQDGADLGVTVHTVTAEMDEGPRLLQRKTAARGEQISLAEARRRGSWAEQRLVREAVMRWK